MRWAAPEVINGGTYTSCSDIWAFGITVWELFSHCELPYAGFTEAQVIENILRGHRLEKPKFKGDIGKKHVEVRIKKTRHDENHFIKSILFKHIL